jgi:K+-sensing histidine kinase KdpD
LPWHSSRWSAPTGAQLVQAIAEELAAGLSSVTSAREVLLEPRAIVANPESARQMLSIMARGITRLGALSQVLRDLIDLADLQQGKAACAQTRVDVRQVVHRAVEEVGQPAVLFPTPFQVSLEGSAPVLSVDPVRVRRALVHLLALFQRATNGASQVLVTGRPARGSYEISIQARPASTDPAARGRVRSVRDEATETRERRGRYLALLVAHGYVSASGGQMRLEGSATGLRSVTCVLPVAPVAT